MSLHFRDEGEGAPIVLVHGLGASGRIFDPLFARRAGRRLIAIDLPRTGRSQRWADSTPEAIGEGLVRFLDTRDVGRFHLFGHSFGGLVALHVAAAHAARIEGLTVASTPALGLPPEAQLLLHSPMLDLAAPWLGRMPVWRPALRSYLQLIWGPRAELQPHHLDLYEEATRADGFFDGMVEALRAAGRFRPDFEVLARADFPRRVLWGAQDRLVSVAQGEQLARALKAELTVLPDVGHCLTEEHPDAVFEAVHA
jgi:pimeloyl-ACP methyl ester carboxylesterase